MADKRKYYYLKLKESYFDDAPHGPNIEPAAVIKQNVSIPVAAVGGINSPEQAEEAIASGKIDTVSMGRQFFADPAFPNKAKEALLAGILFFWVAGNDFVLAAVNKGAGKPIGAWFYPLSKYVYCVCALLALIAGALLGGIG